jgi:NitT/TauT family transport system substrate-binding protein
MNRRIAALFAIVAVALTACGSGGGTAATPDAEGRVPITITAIAVSAAAPIELGVRKGFFAEEGLDATINYAEAPAAIPSVVSGDAQFAFLNAPAVLVARNNGVPVKAVTGISVPEADPTMSYLGLLVRPDSDLQTPADLVGRTVAVDTLYQLPDLSLRHALRTAGVDPATVNFVELPFAQMVDALNQGQVDAINAAEPFVSGALKAGARMLLSASTGQDGTWPHSVVLTSESYLSQNPDVVDRFVRAMAKADDYARNNQDEVRAVVPSFTRVPEEAAKVIRLPVFTAQFDPAGWQAWADVLVANGLVEPDLAAQDAYYNP